MATKYAQQQLEFGWDTYQKGGRGQTLWTNMKGFAKSRRFPTSYENPLHGLKQLANSGSLDSTNALRAFLLACELASLTKGLKQHVVLLTGQRAKILRPTDLTATIATIEEARRKLGLIDTANHQPVRTVTVSDNVADSRRADLASGTEAVESEPLPVNANAFEIGRQLLVNHARNSLELSKSQAELAVDLHLDPATFAMDRVKDYASIQQAIRNGTTYSDVVSLIQLEDISSILGIFRVHCRNFVNRSQGVSDINTGGVNPAKAPRILQFLDGLDHDKWRNFSDISILSRHYQSVAASAPPGIFDSLDVRSFQIGEQMGEQLNGMKASEAVVLGMKQGWFKTLRGIADGVDYLNRYQFDASQFHHYVREHLNTHSETNSLLQEYKNSVFEVGDALAANFFGDLGFVEFSKPDTHVTKIVEGITGKRKSASEVFQYVGALAHRCGVHPRQMDKIFFLTGSGSLYLTDWKLGGDGELRRQELISHIK